MIVTVRGSIHAGVAHGPRTQNLGSLGPAPSVVFFLCVVLVICTRRGLALITYPHTHIPADADSTALLCDGAAEGGALRQPRELLGTENGEVI